MCVEMGFLCVRMRFSTDAQAHSRKVARLTVDATTFHPATMRGPPLTTHTAASNNKCARRTPPYPPSPSPCARAVLPSVQKEVYAASLREDLRQRAADEQRIARHEGFIKSELSLDIPSSLLASEPGPDVDQF